jgi:hypothetical protein
MSLLKINGSLFRLMAGLVCVKREVEALERVFEGVA